MSQVFEYAPTGFEHLTPNERDFIGKHLTWRRKIIRRLGITDATTGVALLDDLKKYDLNQLSSIMRAPKYYCPQSKIQQIRINFKLPSQTY